ncbi:hypothetical protein [Nocardia flavorosea]|uniref:Uncharacterized protein n=1 Tax=Nocardia flavorosea TaxID=53429 RepID=A0A846YH05_9NOCA|nr:hypothetical protein [Nocardia flavorosea]NKY56922.1 hypothetical protein [Nocardia flavorosea]
MRHIGRPPNLARVVVLVFALVVLTFGIQHGPNPETASSEKLSFVHTVVAMHEPIGYAIAVSPDKGSETVHCPYHCVRAPAVRPRVGYLWYPALLIAGLLIAGVYCRRWDIRPRAARRTAIGAVGAELLLHLCVCRR